MTGMMMNSDPLILSFSECRTARLAMRRISDHGQVHGLTDGTWSYLDALRELLRLTGPSDIAVSTWTAAKTDTIEAERLLRSGRVKSWRMLVDASFKTRQPAYCELVRKKFGDDAVRVWNCHAKFSVITGGEFEVLYLTSANLNRNRRIENFSIYREPKGIVARYMRLVEDLFTMQKPGDGFSGATVGRHDAASLAGDKKR